MRRPIPPPATKFHPQHHLNISNNFLNCDRVRKYLEVAEQLSTPKCSEIFQLCFLPPCFDLGYETWRA
ncbi:hypothetical protein RchiOBHm_Chr2g0125781 [Rosa chinensis]|uniref:Uncharacterized protein n=1 Tax=Rosa chinensis TaxID=74649 RepID=A0A2P6RTM1_ROSCH|nr:hypothetical protein RchiOBHm_Chr2g0125781 [Rosa chinensis]